MNFAAFNFLSVKPCGWTLALAALLAALIFGITAEAKMPAACPVVRVAGDISFGGVHTVEIGVTEKSAGGARGSAAGIPISSNHKSKNGRHVETSPLAAIAVSAANHPELRRA